MPLERKVLPRELLLKTVKELQEKGFMCIDMVDYHICEKPINEVQFKTYIFEVE